VPGLAQALKSYAEMLARIQSPTMAGAEATSSTALLARLEQLRASLNPEDKEPEPELPKPIPEWSLSTSPRARRITEVLDGDTVMLDGGYGRARLFLPEGLNAQEMSEPGGAQMKSFLQQFVGRQVHVEDSPEGADAYGRALVRLTSPTGEYDINLMMKEQISKFSEAYIAAAPDDERIVEALKQNVGISWRKGLTYSLGRLAPRRVSTWNAIQERNNRLITANWQADRERAGRTSDTGTYEDIQSQAALALAAPAEFAGIMASAIPFAVAANAPFSVRMATTKWAGWGSQFARSAGAGVTTDAMFSAGAYLEDGQSWATHMAVNMAIGGVLEPAFVLPFMKVALKNEIGLTWSRAQVRNWAKKHGLPKEEAEAWFATSRVDPSRMSPDEAADLADTIANTRPAGNEASPVMPQTPQENQVFMALAAHRNLTLDKREPAVILNANELSTPTTAVDVDFITTDGRILEVPTIPKLGATLEDGTTVTAEIREDIFEQIRQMAGDAHYQDAMHYGEDASQFRIGQVRGVSQDEILDVWNNLFDPDRLALLERRGWTDAEQAAPSDLRWDASDFDNGEFVRQSACGSPCETRFGSVVSGTGSKADYSLDPELGISVWSKEGVPWWLGRFRANVQGRGILTLNARDVSSLSELDKHVLAAQQARFDSTYAAVREGGDAKRTAEVVQKARAFGNRTVRRIKNGLNVSDRPTTANAAKLLELSWAPAIRGSKESFWKALKGINIVQNGKQLTADEKLLQYITALTDRVLRGGEITVSQKRMFPYLARLEGKVRAGEVAPDFDPSPIARSRAQVISEEADAIAKARGRGLGEEPKGVPSALEAQRAAIRAKLEDLPAEVGAGADLYKSRTGRATLYGKERADLEAELAGVEEQIAAQQAGPQFQGEEVSQVGLFTGQVERNVVTPPGYSGATSDVYSPAGGGGAPAADPRYGTGRSKFAAEMRQVAVELRQTSFSGEGEALSPYAIQTKLTRQTADPQPAELRTMQSQIRAQQQKIDDLLATRVEDRYDPALIQGGATRFEELQPGEKVPFSLELQKEYDVLAELNIRYAEGEVQVGIERASMELQVIQRMRTGLVLEGRSQMSPDKARANMQRISQIDSRAQFLQNRIQRAEGLQRSIQADHARGSQVQAAPGEMLVDFGHGPEAVPRGQIQLLRPTLEVQPRGTKAVPRFVRISAMSTSEPRTGLILHRANRGPGFDPNTGKILPEPEQTGYVIIPGDGMMWPWLDRLQASREVFGAEDVGTFFHVDAYGNVQLTVHNTRSVLPNRPGNATEGFPRDSVQGMREAREGLASRERMALGDVTSEQYGFPVQPERGPRSTEHAASPEFMRGGRQHLDPTRPGQIHGYDAAGRPIDIETQPATPLGYEGQFRARHEVGEDLYGGRLQDMYDPMLYRYEDKPLFDEFGNPVADMDAAQAAVDVRKEYLDYGGDLGSLSPADRQAVLMGDMEIEDALSGARRLRQDVPEGVQILDPDVEGVGVYTVLSEAEGGPYQMNKDFFQNPHLWGTEAPTRVVHAVRGAQKLIKFGLDPETKVSVVHSAKGNNYHPDVSPDMTLKELAEAQMPQAGPAQLMDLAKDAGVGIEFHGTGAWVYAPGREPLKFSETLEAAEYLKTIQVELPALNIEDGLERALNMGRARHVDPEIDSKAWVPTELQVQLGMMVKDGKRMVAELRYAEGNLDQFRAVFDVDSGQNVLDKARSGKYEIGPDGSMVLPNDQFHYVELPRKAGVSPAMPSNRVAIINKPAAASHIAQHRNLLVRIGINPDASPTHPHGMSVDQVIVELDRLPQGLDFFSDDPMSAVMYTFQRQKGLTENFSAAKIIDDGAGPRRQYSLEEKDAWNWNVCRR